MRVRLAVACVGFLVRLALSARSIVALDRQFVPDDTYYTLSVARSLARGLGPTVDGEHLTTGFQPLLAFLLVPVMRVTEDVGVLLHVSFAIGALSDFATAFFVGELAERITGDRSAKVAGIAATALWSFSTAAIATSLNGLETSLAIACTTSAVAFFARALEKRTTRAWLSTGALLGACLLARVDTVFLVACIGGVMLWRAGPKVALLSAAAAFVVVLPWWGYCLARFGTIVPESGSAVLEQALIQKAQGMNVRDHMGWGASAVIGPPLVDSEHLRTFLGNTASGLGCALTIVLVIALLVLARKHASDPLRVLAVQAAALLLFYTLYLPAMWFFRRYLVPVHVVLTLLIALGVARAWERKRGVAVAIVGAVAVNALVGIVRFATIAPAMSVDAAYHGTKGYLEPAREVLALAPEGAVVGSLQSGALGWLAGERARDKRVRVVNLDGVVDGEAARALREGRLAAFARSRGVTHFADWDLNVRVLMARAGDSGRFTKESLRKIGEASPQTFEDRFVVYAIDWPSAER